MSDERVLLHLTTPAEWRTALAAGAVRPPSLAEVGFVHLSTPAQVSLPADRLFPGRRDVVLLVVDPARLTDPVRWEPGVPGDPASMRFPHLYGPLPPTAVVAVVPWRADAPLPLPTPDDAAARALAMAVSVPLRRAAAVEDVPGGFAVLDPDDRLLLTGAVTADEVAGRSCCRATLLHPAAGPVADELARRGSAVTPALVLAHRTPAAVHPSGAAAQVREEDRPLRPEQGTDRVVQVVDLGVREGGAVAASAQLWIDGASACIASVATRPASRRRGHARALATSALHRAGAAGCDLVWLQVPAPNAPRWCADLGFEVVARTWDVVRRPGPD